MIYINNYKHILLTRCVFFVFFGCMTGQVYAEFGPVGLDTSTNGKICSQSAVRGTSENSVSSLFVMSDFQKKYLATTSQDISSPIYGSPDRHNNYYQGAAAGKCKQIGGKEFTNGRRDEKSARDTFWITHTPAYTDILNTSPIYTSQGDNGIPTQLAVKLQAYINRTCGLTLGLDGHIGIRTLNAARICSPACGGKCAWTDFETMAKNEVLYIDADKKTKLWDKNTQQIAGGFKAGDKVYIDRKSISTYTSQLKNTNNYQTIGSEDFFGINGLGIADDVKPVSPLTHCKIGNDFTMTGGQFDVIKPYIVEKTSDGTGPCTLARIQEPYRYDEETKIKPLLTADVLKNLGGTTSSVSLDLLNKLSIEKAKEKPVTLEEKQKICTTQYPWITNDIYTTLAATLDVKSTKCCLVTPGTMWTQNTDKKLYIYNNIPTQTIPLCPVSPTPNVASTKPQEYACPLKPAATPNPLLGDVIYNSSKDLLNNSTKKPGPDGLLDGGSCQCAPGYTREMKKDPNGKVEVETINGEVTPIYQCMPCNTNSCNCGMKLNTYIPFVGRCIMYADTNNTSANDPTGTTVNSLNAFPVLMTAMIKLMMSLLLMGCFGSLIVGGVMYAMPGSQSDGEGLIKKVLYIIAGLGSSGVILYIVNPNFFR